VLLKENEQNILFSYRPKYFQVGQLLTGIPSKKTAKHTADEAVVKEKMRLTLAYRQKMLHDPKESSDILSVFTRFKDISGLVCDTLNL